jgi:hypothetical protein
MKKLVELIEIEKSFNRNKKSLQKTYITQSQDYIARAKDNITVLQKEILNKNQIVSERLASYKKRSNNSNLSEIKLDVQKIKKLILSQL